MRPKLSLEANETTEVESVDEVPKLLRTEIERRSLTFIHEYTNVFIYVDVYFGQVGTYSCIPTSRLSIHYLKFQQFCKQLEKVKKKWFLPELEFVNAAMIGPVDEVAIEFEC